MGGPENTLCLIRDIENVHPVLEKESNGGMAVESFTRKNNHIVLHVKLCRQLSKSRETIEFMPTHEMRGANGRSGE
jgi:hypothetical protein